jgi:hypothetical protein
MRKNGVINKARLMPENVVLTDFESTSGIAVSVECAEMITYPAITTGLLIEPHCLGKKAEKNKNKLSWFEQLFTD